MFIETLLSSVNGGLDFLSLEKCASLMELASAYAPTRDTIDAHHLRDVPSEVQAHHTGA